MGAQLQAVNDTAIENLCNAIVLQAVDDYGNAYMGNGMANKSAEAVMHECERFFESDWCNSLTKLSGGFLMNAAKIRELETVIDIYDKAVGRGNDGVFKIQFRKTKESPAQVLVIPPNLVGDFEDVVRKQLKGLRKELATLTRAVSADEVAASA